VGLRNPAAARGLLRTAPLGVNDLPIAPHARGEGLTLVSNNLRQFERLQGLLYENWV
jgi:tRNA(fMet)-specific endonuclease VapC